MKKNSPSQAGLFNPRALLAFALCSIGAGLGFLSFASTPSSGTLTDVSGPINYTAGPFFVANPTPVIEVDSGPECDNPIQPCDDYALTVTLPAGYAAAHPNAAVKVAMGWTDTGGGASDFDLYIYKNPRGDCSPQDCTVTDGSEAADFQSASSANPEIAYIGGLTDGTQKYTVVVVPYKPTGETVNVKIELLPGSAASTTPFGGADPTTPGVPRYQNFYAPDGTSAQSGAGEFNIGFNPHSGRIMTMNIGPIWRITPPELLAPAKPECCEGLWEDKSNPATNTGLDPILWTDQKTGRTFSSNSTVGANAVYGYTDNDGDLWVPFGIAAPNGGADHETIGSGPYPASLSALITAVNQGEAVYYCSQDIVGPASCYRSDTLGASYGPGVLAYTGQGAGSCGGLHGHIHVAPDGTAWLPVNQCSGLQGGVFSTDGGVTWNTFTVPNAISQIQGADPSIAIDSDSNIYYAYVNNEPVPAGNTPEGHARAVKGHRNADNTITWSNYFDLGTSHGIVNAAEIEAVGGSSGRAAVGFLGTDRPGDYQASGFPGKWYAFIATTYNGGASWTTVNATPNDPVQSMTGIWQQGGSHDDRNLLDFNEITVDDKGRVLYGYSDGCVSEGCIGGTAPNDFVAFMRVARQSGGKSVFASNDPNTDTLAALAPKPPCLSGTRDVTASHLSWKAPDNGGSDITSYQIFRGFSSGTEVLLGQTSGSKTTFQDTTADPSVAHYFYIVKAINAIGTSNASNEIDLTVGPTPPVILPYSCSGNNVVTDASGDAINPAPGGLGPTSQADITAISFSADTPATTITTEMTLANLTDTPSPGTTFTTYYVVWTGSNGKTYATQVDVSPGPVVTYTWGEFNTGNNQLSTFNSTTGTFNPGVNGTITADVPRSGVGNPTIPITNVNGTPAVTNPYGLTIAGEGAVGSGLVFTQPMDRAPNTGFGQKWAVCPPPLQITIQTTPAGRTYTVDGAVYIATHTFSWTRGSTHTIAAPTPQDGGTGVRYSFSSWSDGGAISHTVAPTTNTTYTAKFGTQYYLTMNAGTGGKVSPASSWRTAGTSVSISATPSAGYSFSKWTGSGAGSFSGTTNPVSITMNGPITETATFTPPFQVTVQATPAGRTFSVDGTNYSAAKTFNWTPGSSHTIATTSPQSGDPGVRYNFSSWSDGGAISHTVAPTMSTTYTAKFGTQYFLTMSAGTGGNVSPGSGWHTSGSTFSISATPSNLYSFSNWTGSGSGSYSGTNNPASITMNAPISETATFTHN
jgi:List-Bact-rpt repeat protein